MENELRIGSAFCQKGSNFVEYATFETFDLLRRKVIIIEPVPISEKWLLTFGFENTKKDVWKKWSIDLGYCEIDKTFSFDSKRVYIDVFHVHQLQNLYFALTAEELKLKEL